MRLYLRAWFFAVLFLFSLNSVLVTAVSAVIRIMPLGTRLPGEPPGALMTLATDASSFCRWFKPATN